MNKKSSPYMRNIWERDARYDVSGIDLNKERKTIARLMSVDSAKKRTPPLPLGALLDIAKEAKKIRRLKKVKSEDIEAYLSKLIAHRGAGIPTLICMLAVESDGKFPPMDRKFAGGLLRKGKISEEEFKLLIGNNAGTFSRVYVQKAIPAWTQTRKRLSARDADNYWGRGGEDE